MDPILPSNGVSGKPGAVQFEMMLVVVSYDVATGTPDGRRRLRHAAKECQNFGQRVQNSVFECLVDPTQWADLRHRLLSLYDSNEDSLRFYFLGAKWRGKKEHHGAKETQDPEGPLLV
jgi:CRISPR-associated protein Cas2